MAQHKARSSRGTQRAASFAFQAGSESARFETRKDSFAPPHDHRVSGCERIKRILARRLLLEALVLEASPEGFAPGEGPDSQAELTPLLGRHSRRSFCASMPIEHSLAVLLALYARATDFPHVFAH